MILRAAALVLIALASSTGGALAHEFWIDVQDYTIAPGEDIVADLRVGQTYAGNSYSYRKDAFTRFEIASGNGLARVESRLGDRPALHQPAPEGLAVVIHVTTNTILTWEDFAVFQSFVEHKAAAGVLEAHAARGLPETGFREVYSRYAKALVAVGDGAGSDREFGLATEIVAEANPYTDDLSAGLPVQVLYNGAPKSGAQVEIFDKAADGTVAVTTVLADDQGRALVPVAPRASLHAGFGRAAAAERDAGGAGGCGVGKPLGQPHLCGSRRRLSAVNHA